MGNRPTPIERAIAGEPADRRRRYDARMRSKGFVRFTATVDPEAAAALKPLVRLLREDPAAAAKLRARLDALESPERPQPGEDAPRSSSAPRGRS